ncbi:MAG: 1-acyl-sn-glycerol-3-phosphate acyltransferase [Cytophagales bacterium]|nr:MAG: 1-acyl-sn-glycerol-3-phosphate acyltransferase [Cytophagales bacterium]TAF61960.1 MAG: 1-acyl-sn-glycerol-3-phosphate acyltransferase [Cytophagales bacterium]
MTSPFRFKNVPKFKAPKLGGGLFKHPLFTRLNKITNIKLPKTGIKLFKKDPFGNFIMLKSALMSFFGVITYYKFNIINKLKITGMEHLMNLPSQNVLFISNHETYYADVIAMFHVFGSVKMKFKDINVPIYTLFPRVNSYYVAAEETMVKSGILPKLYSYAGAITVRRSWRQAGTDIKGNSDIKAPSKIKKALEDGWVITFPQGTTKEGAPIRKGAAHLIKTYSPVVVPVRISGFKNAFDKRGIYPKRTGVKLGLDFMAPVQFAPDDSLEHIHNTIRRYILPESSFEEQKNSHNEEDE